MVLIVNEGSEDSVYARFPREHRDDYMHDAVVDHDPRFLEWQAVESFRKGLTVRDGGSVAWDVDAVDMLPEVES